MRVITITNSHNSSLLPTYPLSLGTVICNSHAFSMALHWHILWSLNLSSDVREIGSEGSCWDAPTSPQKTSTNCYTTLTLVNQSFFQLFFPFLSTPTCCYQIVKLLYLTFFIKMPYGQSWFDISFAFILVHPFSYVLHLNADRGAEWPGDGD